MARLNTGKSDMKCEKFDSQLVIKHYEKTIEDLKKELLKKEKQNKRLSEDHENNLAESEAICIENNNLRKKLSQCEKSKAMLLEDQEILEQKICQLQKEKEEYEAEFIENIDPIFINN